MKKYPNRDSFAVGVDGYSENHDTGFRDGQIESDGRR